MHQGGEKITLILWSSLQTRGKVLFLSLSLSYTYVHSYSIKCNWEQRLQGTEFNGLRLLFWNRVNLFIAHEKMMWTEFKQRAGNGFYCKIHSFLRYPCDFCLCKTVQNLKEIFKIRTVLARKTKEYPPPIFTFYSHIKEWVFLFW